MRIGALAKFAHTSAETIRYYEREGLLPAPARTAGNYRDYGQEHRGRLAFIRQCRTLAMSLDEVRLLLARRDTPKSTCDDVDALIGRHLSDTSRRISELQQLESELKALRACCSRGRSSRLCGIIRGIEGAAFSTLKEGP